MDDDNNIPRILLLGIIIAFAILLILSSNVFTNPANSTYAQNSSNNSNNASNDNNNTHGLDRLANVTINGKSYPIRYGITNGKVLSIVQTKLILKSQQQFNLIIKMENSQLNFQGI